MTAKIVSIRTRSGDDLTPAPTCYPVQTMSQRQAILAICNRADPPLWPAVKRRLISATEDPYGSRFTWNSRWIRAILLVVAATAASFAIIWKTL